MDDCLDNISENFTNWETLRGNIDLDIDLDDVETEQPSQENPSNPRIHLFCRQDINLYGTMPKIEQRIYTKCKDCKLIFNPQDVLSHRICTEINTVKSYNNGRKINKNRNGTMKKSSSLPLPPAFVEKPKEQDIFEINSDLVTWNGSRSKKTRRTTGNKTVAKEFDPDMHCGVIEGAKGPCTRSITCSNHRIQMKKLVPGRSKEVQQLIAERRLAKDLKVVIDVDDKELIKTEIIPDVEIPAVDEEIAVVKDEEVIEMETEVIKIEETPPQILFKPISPLSIEHDLSCDVTAEIPITSEKITFAIPNLDSNLPLYKSHPKPASLPSYKRRRGSIFSNFHIQMQRNDVLKAINDNLRINTVKCDSISFKKWTNFNDRNGLEAIVEPKDRKFNHFVISDGINGNIMNGMQENIGFKKIV